LKIGLEYEARIVNLDEMIDISVKEREIIIVKEQEESKFSKKTHH